MAIGLSFIYKDIIFQHKSFYKKGLNFSSPFFRNLAPPPKVHCLDSGCKNYTFIILIIVEMASKSIFSNHLYRRQKTVQNCRTTVKTRGSGRPNRLVCANAGIIFCKKFWECRLTCAN